MAKPKRLPRPYQKPGINVIGAGHGKKWQDITAVDVEDGDIVVGLGLVVAVALFNTSVIRIFFKSGKQESYHPDAPLRVFTRDRSGNSD